MKKVIQKILRAAILFGIYMFAFSFVGAMLQKFGVPTGAVPPLVFAIAISYFWGRRWLRKREKRNQEEGESVRGSGLGDAQDLAKKLKEVD